MINDKDIENISDYSMIDFTKSDIDKMDLDTLKENIEILKTLDLEDVKPLYKVFDYSNPLREDIPKKGINREDVLKQARDSQYGFLKLENIREE